MIGAKNLHPNAKYDESQVFLPESTKLSTKSNIDFISNFLEEHSIDIIINQSALNTGAVVFLNEARRRNNVKIYGALHNSVLTPIENYAYQKQYTLEKHYLSFLYHILKTKIFSKFLVTSYIHRNKDKFATLFKNSDKVIVLCDGLKNELLKFGNKSWKQRIEVIPNFVPDKKSSSLNTHKENSILWVGTIDFNTKRIDLMLDVWKDFHKKHPQFKLYILGDGPGYLEAQKLAKKHNLNNVTFTGRVDPAPYYKIAKAICVTSTHESFSLVTVEAMRYGVIPIVFNSFPAASMILDNDISGFLIRPFDIHEFSDKLSSVLSNSSLFSKMSLEAENKAKQFSGNSIYTLWKHLFLNGKK